MRHISNKTIFPPARILASIVFIIAIIAFPIACQKGDQQSTSQTDLASQQAAKQQILALIKKNGKSITVPVYQRMQFYYGDSAGNQIARHNSATITAGTKTTAGIVSGCDGDPNGYASN